MRTISYKCDRCGKPVIPRGITKLNLNMQKGSNPIEKKTFDFCSPCFLKVKSAFLSAVEYEGNISPEDKIPDVVSSKQDVGEKNKVSDAVLSKQDTDEETVSQEPEATPADSTGKKRGRPRKQTDETVPSGLKKRGRLRKETAPRIMEKDKTFVNLGPLSAEERKEILRLHVEEELSADQIAEKLNRLPRGIKRTINSAAKSGELDKLVAEFLRKKAACEAQAESEEEEESESNSGSGASNAGITKDAYTAPPKTEVIDGKRYDVGCILALVKAGWTSDKIAEERHYDEDVVRVIIEKYM